METRCDNRDGHLPHDLCLGIFHDGMDVDEHRRLQAEIQLKLNPGRHRVWLPGPITGRAARIIEHDPECKQRECVVAAGLAQYAAVAGQFAVQGDYFTSDGKMFERCTWQPTR